MRQGPPGTALIRRAYEDFLSGVMPDQDVVRAMVRDSWARSMRRGVNPDSAAPSVGATRRFTEAEFARYRNQHPMSVAMEAVRSLIVDDLVGTGAVVAVTDQDGRLLWVEGDTAARRAADSIDFVAGALWSEDVMGTNAPALALAMDRGVQVVGPEHFAAGIQEWNCAAAPVHDPVTGDVVGVIDVTGGAAVAMPFALATVRSVVAAVEGELRVRAGERAPSPPRRSAPAGEARLIVLADGGARWHDAGDSRDRPLSRRHAEILVLLQAYPEGLGTEQLALMLAEDDLDPVTVRAEISRLRRDVGAKLIGSRPYQIAGAMGSDVADLRASIREGGDVRKAIAALGRGGLLTESTAPGIEELFTELREDLRSRVLAEAEVPGLRAWTECVHGRDDLAAWRMLAQRLPAADPQRALAAGRVRLLDRRFGVR